MCQFEHTADVCECVAYRGWFAEIGETSFRGIHDGVGSQTPGVKERQSHRSGDVLRWLLGETLPVVTVLAAGSAVDFGDFFGIQTEGRVDLADGVLQFVFCGHHGNSNFGSGDQINVGASFVQSIEEGC